MEESKRRLGIAGTSKDWPDEAFEDNEFAMMVAPQDDGTYRIELRCVRHDMVKEIFTPEVAEGVHMMALDAQVSKAEDS